MRAQGQKKYLIASDRPRTDGMTTRWKQSNHCDTQAPGMLLAHQVLSRQGTALRLVIELVSVPVRSRRWVRRVKEAAILMPVCKVMNVSTGPLAELTTRGISSIFHYLSITPESTKRSHRYAHIVSDPDASPVCSSHSYLGSYRTARLHRARVRLVCTLGTGRDQHMYATTRLTRYRCQPFICH